MKKLQEIIVSIIPSEKDYIFGFANLTGLLNKKYKGYDYAIVIGKKLDDKIIDSIESGPNREYYRHYNEVNGHLFELQKKISEKLKEHHISFIIIEPTTHDKDLDEGYFNTLRFDFSHKMAATRAGLGWIGKTDLFISKKFGPRLRLATTLIDRPVSPLSPPIDKSMCSECRVCVDACPAGAANGGLWGIDVDRDEFYNAFKCRDMARKLSGRNIGEEVSLCGICVSVCPRGCHK